MDTAGDQEKRWLWCMENFVRLGYSEDEARILADYGVDYHEVERLVERGCSLSLAARICFPL